MEEYKPQIPPLEAGAESVDAGLDEEGKEKREKLVGLQAKIAQMSPESLLEFLKGVAKGGYFTSPEVQEKNYDGDLDQDQVSSDMELAVLMSIEKLD